MTEQLYKFEPRLEVFEFSKTVPDDRSDGMISILILEWFVILSEWKQDVARQGRIFVERVPPESSKSRENQKIRNFRFLNSESHFD